MSTRKQISINGSTLPTPNLCSITQQLFAFSYRASHLHRPLPPIVRNFRWRGQVWRLLELLERRGLKIPVLARSCLWPRSSRLHVGRSSARMQKRRFVSCNLKWRQSSQPVLWNCRSCQRIRLPCCRRNRKRRILLTTCSSRRLQKVLHLPWGSRPRIRMPNWNSLQDRRFRWLRKLRRPRRCSRMVSSDFVSVKLLTRKQPHTNPSQCY